MTNIPRIPQTSAPHPAAGRFSEVALYLCLTALALCFFGRFLGGVPMSGDMTLFYAPLFSLRWDHGLPLWNPYFACGMPMDANFQFSAVYPLRLPFYFIPDWRLWFGGFVWLHYVVALWGTASLLRSMGLSRAASFAGAAMFGCGGYMTGRVINTTAFIASSWLPCLIRGAVDPRPGGGLIGGLAVAMILWTGSPHLIAYGAMGFGLVWLASVLADCWISHCRHKPCTFGRWLLRWAYVALGVGAGLVNLLPGLSASRESIRTEATTQSVLQDSLSWGEVPFSFLGGAGGPVNAENQDKCLYVGGAALFLILLGLLRPASWRDRRWHTGLVLTLSGIAIALGRNIGWDKALPYLWGLRELEGPARALALSALGLAILASLGAESARSASPLHWFAAFILSAAGFAWLARIALQAPDFQPIWWPRNEGIGQILWEWLVAPRSAVGRQFTLVNTPLTVGAAALLALAFLGRRSARPILAALIALQLWHFSPRIRIDVEPWSAFDPSPPVEHIQALQGDEPFRIAVFDPLRFHHTEMDSLHKTRFLIANMPTLYGLEDIAGFDPLIPLEYKRLFQRTSGIPAFNDPIRHIDPARPDEELFRELNVRFLIGHPADRRLTNIPFALSPASPEVRVKEWAELPESAPLAGWHFVSFLDSGAALKMGDAIASLVVKTDKEESHISIHYGVETAHLFEYESSLAGFHASPNMAYSVTTTDRETGFRSRALNYRRSIFFPEPWRVRDVTWLTYRNDITLSVLAQGFRLAEPGEPSHWRESIYDPIAPVYEFTDAKPRASLVSSWSVHGREVESDGHAENPGKVNWLHRSLNGLSLEADPSTDSLLLLRNSWARGWKARVDGRPAPVLRVNRLFQGIELTPGRHRIEMIYFPAIFFGALALAAASLGALAALWSWDRSRLRGD